MAEPVVGQIRVAEPQRATLAEREREHVPPVVHEFADDAAAAALDRNLGEEARVAPEFSRHTDRQRLRLREVAEVEAALPARPSIETTAEPWLPDKRASTKPRALHLHRTTPVPRIPG